MQAKETRSSGWGEARSNGDCEKLRMPVLVMRNASYLDVARFSDFCSRRKLKICDSINISALLMLATNSIFLTVAQI